MNLEWKFTPQDDDKRDHWCLHALGKDGPYVCLCSTDSWWLMCVMGADNAKLANYRYRNKEAAQDDALARLTAVVVGAE